MRIIVAGSSDFYDYSILRTEVNEFILNLFEYNYLSEEEEIIVVSGGANGADKMGERFAKEFGHKCEVYPADWSQGKKAGILRNIQMGNIADACIVFIVNESSGSTHMAEYSYSKGLETRVINIINK